jgi:hypothetical protein
VNLSSTIRNQMLAQYYSVLGNTPVVEIRTGIPPTSCSAADTGTLLVSITLPTNWITVPTDGVITIQGVWIGTATSDGNAGHYRIKTTGGICHEQGTVYQGTGSGDMSLDNINISVNQLVQVVTWTRTQGGQ